MKSLDEFYIVKRSFFRLALAKVIFYLIFVFNLFTFLSFKQVPFDNSSYVMRGYPV